MPHLDARLSHWLFALPIGVALYASVPAFAQQAAAPSIIAPVDGQVLQGQVSVKGSTDIQDFSSAELAFTYATEPNASWFVIQTASLPVSNSELMVWDTTSISDGDYILRLRVLLLGGGFQDAAGECAGPELHGDGYVVAACAFRNHDRAASAASSDRVDHHGLRDTRTACGVCRSDTEPSAREPRWRYAP